MDRLKDLIDLLKREQISNLSIKENKLLRLVKKGMSVEKIIAQLFPAVNNSKKSLSELKHRLTKKLIGHFFVTEGKSYKKSEIKIRRDFYLFMILKLFGKKSAFNLGKNLVTRALKYDLHDITLRTAQALLLYHIEVVKNKKLYLHYRTIAKTAVQNIEVENTIFNNYCDAINEIDFNRDIKPVGYRSGFFHYTSLIYDCEHKKQYQGILDACQEGLSYLKNKPYDTSIPRVRLIRKSVIPLIIYGDATDLIDRCLKVPEYETNRLNLLTYKAISQSYQEQYQSAIQTTTEAIQKATNPYTIQQIKIIEAWAYLMTDQPYKIAKLLNEVTIFEKEKTHDKASLRLLQFFHLFKRGDTDRIYDMVDSFKLYKNRYLRQSPRMRIMFQIIDLVIRSSFESDKYQKLVQDKLDQLSQLPVENLNVEPVPFDRVVRELLF